MIDSFLKSDIIILENTSTLSYRAEGKKHLTQKCSWIYTLEKDVLVCVRTHVQDAQIYIVDDSSRWRHPKYPSRMSYGIFRRDIFKDQLVRVLSSFSISLHS